MRNEERRVHQERMLGHWHKIADRIRKLRPKPTGRGKLPSTRLKEEREIEKDAVALAEMLTILDEEREQAA